MSAIRVPRSTWELFTSGPLRLKLGSGFATDAGCVVDRSAIHLWFAERTTTIQPVDSAAMNH
jgi:hypothetical protein